MKSSSHKNDTNRYVNIRFKYHFLKQVHHTIQNHSLSRTFSKEDSTHSDNSVFYRAIKILIILKYRNE